MLCSQGCPSGLKRNNSGGTQTRVKATVSTAQHHPNMATVLNNLAELLKTTGRAAESEPLMRRTLAINERTSGAEHPDVAISLNNLAGLLWATKRLEEAEPLMRRAVAITEQYYGTEHPAVVFGLGNWVNLLHDTDRLAEIEVLARRSLAIASANARRTGHEDDSYQWYLNNYHERLGPMNLSEDEIARRVKDATEFASPLKPIAVELERLLGPAKPVSDVLAALDRQYKADGKPAIFFLRLDQPMTPHLDQFLGRSKLDVPLDEPIVPHLEKLLGPVKSTQEVFETLDRQAREQNKPAIWFLPLSQPIAPHLDALLGPTPAKHKE